MRWEMPSMARRSSENRIVPRASRPTICTLHLSPIRLRISLMAVQVPRSSALGASGSKLTRRAERADELIVPILYQCRAAGQPFALHPGHAGGWDGPPGTGWHCFAVFALITRDQLSACPRVLKPEFPVHH